MAASLLDPLPPKLAEAVRMRHVIQRPLVDLTRLDGPSDVIQVNAGVARALVADAPLAVVSVDDATVVMEIPRTHEDETWALGLVEEQGILVAPGAARGLGPGHLVVSLKVSPDVFRESMRTLVQFVAERSYGC